MGSKHGPLNERFWRHVVINDGCWVWTGSRKAQDGVPRAGYGEIRISRSKAVLAHRLSWELHRGPIPDGLEVMHRCDNPPCVNPDHLTLGSHAENMADMKAKGRGNGDRRGGASATGAKLTEAQVREIRSERAAGVEIQALALRYRVNRHTITNIVGLRTWVNV
jgi:HNH endonuclease